MKIIINLRVFTGFFFLILGYLVIVECNLTNIILELKIEYFVSRPKTMLVC